HLYFDYAAAIACDLLTYSSYSACVLRQLACFPTRRSSDLRADCGRVQQRRYLHRQPERIADSEPDGELFHDGDQPGPGRELWNRNHKTTQPKTNTDQIQYDSA